MSRSEIQRFCHRVLQGGYHHLHTIADKYEDSYIAITNMVTFTKENFDIRFQSICIELFNRRCSTSYIAALLGFTIHLDHHLEHHSWYKSNIIVNSATEVLVGIKFKPYKDVSMCCIL